MKKHISLLIIGLFLSTFMWAVSTTGPAALKQMNPYTSQMSFVPDDQNIVFKYLLNADAESIDIIVDKDKDRLFEDSEVVYTITDASKLIRSSSSDKPYQHTVTVPMSIFQSKVGDGTYNWAMRANRTAYSEVTHAYPKNWARMVYNMPKGLAIDNNPESDYFGNVYTTESVDIDNTLSNSLSGGTVSGHTKDQGVYAYYATMDQYKHSSSCYQGGVTWGTTNDQYAPFRLTVAPDGMVFVNDNRKSGDGVTAAIYRVNPAKLNTNMSFDKILWPGGMSKCSVDAHPRAISMAVRNDGGTQKLYVLNAYRRTKTGTGSADYAYYPHMHRWTLNGTDIGTKQEKEWVVCKNTTDKVESVLTYGGKNYEIVNQTTTMVPGIYNDLWIAQRRVTRDHNACLMHIKIDGNNLICDFVIVVNAEGKESINADLLKMEDYEACPKGAMALSTDGSLLALASSGHVNVLNVTYDPTTKTPTLTRNEEKSFALSTTAGNPVYVNALAFDRANNIYAISETTHQFYIYALPGQASTTIPAKESMTLNITNTICWHPYPDSYQMTNAELLEIFKHDYKAKYEKDPEFANNSVSDNFMWMLTNESSSWKWLGDYFKTIGVQRRKIPTNEELWGSSNTDQNGFMYYYNQYFNLGNYIAVSTK